MPGFNIGGTGGGPPGTTETARKHRWKFVSLEATSGASSSTGGGMGGIILFAHKAGRPKIEIDRAVMHHVQDEIYLPGKQRWLPIEISFYEKAEDYGDDTAWAIYEWWSRNVLDIRSSSHTQQYKRTCELQLIDGSDATIYKYMMYGCWPSKVTPDDLDYSDTAIAEITVTMQMDKAEEEHGYSPSSKSPDIISGRDYTPAYVPAPLKPDGTSF